MFWFYFGFRLGLVLGVTFEAHFGTQNWSNNCYFLGQFWIPFFWGLGVLWEASRAKKCRQSPTKTTFLKM